MFYTLPSRVIGHLLTACVYDDRSRAVLGREVLTMCWPGVRPFADRARRRFERHRAKLPAGKTLDNFDFGRLPGLSEPRVCVPGKGSDWIDDGHNIVVLARLAPARAISLQGLASPSSSAATASYNARATDLVQRLQAAAATGPLKRRSGGSTRSRVR